VGIVVASEKPTQIAQITLIPQIDSDARSLPIVARPSCSCSLVKNQSFTAKTRREPPVIRSGGCRLRPQFPMKPFLLLPDRSPDIGRQLICEISVISAICVGCCFGDQLLCL